MKYLVIGDSNSMHIYNFVKTFLIPEGYDIYLLTLSTQPIRKEYMDFYKANRVSVFSLAEKKYKGLDRTTRFYRLLNFIRKLRLMKSVPKVDICHLHSVYKTAVLMALRNQNKYKKLILSYWGGDVENRSPAVIKLRERCFQIADVITVTVQQTLNDFREIHGDAYDSKLLVSRFSTDGINCIHALKETATRQECRQSYGIPDHKICITCGYSAYAEQHQERCLAEIQKLPDEVRQKLFVIVPMQYGRFDEAYIERVKQAKERCDFDCVILEEYVPFEMSAKLAIATDIYLHLRDTDAFSNALKEQVYAGSKVITGSWLKYIELEQMNAPVISIDSFDALTGTLSDLIKQYEIPDRIDLFEPIYELYSTESVLNQWKQVVTKAFN